MTTAPTSMQIVINRPFRALIAKKGAPLIEGRASPREGKRLLFYPIAQVGTSDPVRAEILLKFRLPQSPRRRAWRGGRAIFVPRQSVWAGDNVITPSPVALVEGVGRRDIWWGFPRTTNSLGARKAKVLHEVNRAVAQSQIRSHLVDRFYARHFDLRQGSCRRVDPSCRRRLLRMCRQRPCRSHASKQTDELAPM
jgi:hypothetical protein